MKVGIIGSGGREHAICQSLRNSNKIDDIYCFPGNAGTADIAENVILDLENFIEYRHFNLRGNISCDNLSFKYFMHLVASKRPASLSSNDTYVWVPLITISFNIFKLIDIDKYFFNK